MIRVILLLLIITCVACSDNTEGEPIKNGVRISYIANGSLPISLVKGQLYHNGTDTIEFEFPFSNLSGEHSFEHVEAGTWAVEVFAYTDTIAIDSLLRYYVKDTATVIVGQQTDVPLTLNPISGSVNIDVNWKKGE